MNQLPSPGLDEVQLGGDFTKRTLSRRLFMSEAHRRRAVAIPRGAPGRGYF
jgi:hypothetical protein